MISLTCARVEYCLCYTVEQMTLKQTIHRTFNDPAARGFHGINDILALATLISIAALVLETVPSLEAYRGWFRAVEYSAVVLFVAEYVARVYASPRRLQYMTSFYGLVDLISIIPTLLTMTNLLFLKSVRVLRILRLLRMVRLAKMARMKRFEHHDVEDHKAVFKVNIQIYIVVLLSAITVLGSVMYVFEAPRQAFDSIPMGMLWAAETILGGGVTGQFAQTVGGQVTSLVARFVGLVLLGVLISVVGQAIHGWLLGKQKSQQKNTTRRSRTKAKAVR